mmetsp:Transcript_10244/g.18450  ORF Transcript_10244/g.18450 Transcript_10244/m.18450 type:complete len:217 (-) Transcript_10244:923-1573(-)
MGGGRDRDGGIMKKHKKHGKVFEKKSKAKGLVDKNTYNPELSEKKDVVKGSTSAPSKVEKRKGFENRRKGSEMSFEQRIQAMKNNEHWNKPDVERPDASDLDVVIIPIFWRNRAGQRELVVDFAETCQSILQDAMLRVWIDSGHRKLPGSKMKYWDDAGIRVRLEIGPSEAEQRSVILAKVTNPGDVADKKTFFVEDMNLVIKEIQQFLNLPNERK